MTPRIFSHCGLLSLTLVALPGALVEPPLQLRIGTPKIGYLFVERCGHVLLRRPLLQTG
jgi:hypothetical protein